MSFTPDRSPIQDITKSNPGVVTTIVPHGLTTGQQVRINVPKSYGMYEINGKAVSVTVLSSTTFSMQYSQVPVAVNVNTVYYTTFVIPTSSRFTAEVLPIGAAATPWIGPEVNLVNNTCITYVEDATTNTSTSEIPF